MESNKDEEKSNTSSELSEQKRTSDIPNENTEESKPTETSQVLTVFNKTIHHEDDASEDKSLLEIEPPKQNEMKKKGKENKLYTTNFEVKMENEKLKGSYPIHLSNKLSNSRLILDVTKNYGEFMLILDQIKTNGQSMVFYNAWVLNLTENDTKYTFKASCLVALECGIAMDLLF